MNAKLSSVGGAMSVIVFSLLLGQAIVGCMQEDNSPPKGGSPTATVEAAETPGSEGSTLPGFDDDIVLGIDIEDARIDCSSRVPQLSLRATTYAPLPPGTVLLATLLTPGSSDREFRAVGEPQQIPVTITASTEEPNAFPTNMGDSPTMATVSTVEVTLPQSVYVSEYEQFAVTLLAPDSASGGQIQSDTLRLNTAEARCRPGS